MTRLAWNTPLPERFALQTQFGAEDQCWLWLGARMPAGYGSIKVRGATKSAHRVAYWLHYGVDPRHALVTHDCDTKLCVNPRHLRLGTPESNSAEYHHRLRRNSLTCEQADEIRSRYERGVETQQALADEFGVSQAAISHLVRGHYKWAS